MIIKIIKRLFFSKLVKMIDDTQDTQTPINYKMWFFQKILGFNKDVYWPVHFTSIVTGYKNIYAGIDTCPGYMPGCYIQGIGKIHIGDYTQISSNVGIITANHNLYDTRIHEVSFVNIGKYCWLGMNVIILPGVELGNHTIVGAGSVVTKSFKEGYCVIAGNPAKIVKTLDSSKVKNYKNRIEYNGYIKSIDFIEYKSTLNI